MRMRQYHRMQKMRSAMLRRFDQDGDHRLSPAERANARQAGEQMRARAKAGRAQMLQRFDANHDGKLDPAERQGMRQAWQDFLKQPPATTPAPAK